MRARRAMAALSICLLLGGCGGHQDPAMATATAVADAAKVEADKVEERKYDHCLRSHTGTTSGVSIHLDVVTVTYSYESYDRC